VNHDTSITLLDRNFDSSEIRTLGVPQWATAGTYEDGQLRMIPDFSVECSPGQEFVLMPEDVRVFNPAGVLAELTPPFVFFVSTRAHEGLYYLICCDEFPEGGDLDE
jgi:hypothetical protein